MEGFINQFSIFINNYIIKIKKTVKNIHIKEIKPHVKNHVYYSSNYIFHKKLKFKKKLLKERINQCVINKNGNNNKKKHFNFVILIN